MWCFKYAKLILVKSLFCLLAFCKFLHSSIPFANFMHQLQHSNMKATLNKQVKEGKLRSVSGESETNRKEYQFITPPSPSYQGGSSIENITPPPPAQQHFLTHSQWGAAPTTTSQYYSQPNLESYPSTFSGSTNFPLHEQNYGPTMYAGQNPQPQLHRPDEYKIENSPSKCTALHCGMEVLASGTVSSSTSAQQQQEHVPYQNETFNQNQSNFVFLSEENWHSQSNYQAQATMSELQANQYPVYCLTKNELPDSAGVHMPMETSSTTRFQFQQQPPVTQMQQSVTQPTSFCQMPNDPSLLNDPSLQSSRFPDNQYLCFQNAPGSSGSSSVSVPPTKMSKVEQLVSEFRDIDALATGDIGASPFVKQDPISYHGSESFPQGAYENRYSQENRSQLAAPWDPADLFESGSDRSFQLKEEPNKTPLRTPRANLETFERFLQTEEKINFDRLADEDFQLLKQYHQEVKNSWKPFIKDMTVHVYIRARKDEKMRKVQTEIVYENKSKGGFRFVSTNPNSEVDLEDVHRFGPSRLGETKLKAVNLHNGEPVDNDNVQKCLETFGQSGIVFIWKCYDPPDNLERAVGNRDIAAMLCWRLYCYRICKGYHSRDAAEKKRMDASKKVKMLDMCMAGSGEETGRELKIHSGFELVFDLLTQMLSALNIRKKCQQNESEDIAETKEMKETKKCLSIRLGMYSTSKCDSSGLPMRVEIKNNFIQDLVSGQAMTHLEDCSRSNKTRSVLDSNV
ncbi:uncharacterized protein LOC134843642 isoform X2 [Symsagittifera roscoffensis]|uniref:uncharacterized protein LOC134843642 isoform X2 n=1 Tax=Symsagittifera roscoffensis TaxID=84072 RepID=UPI00307C71D2